MIYGLKSLVKEGSNSLTIFIKMFITYELGVVKSYKILEENLEFLLWDRQNNVVKD